MRTRKSLARIHAEHYVTVCLMQMCAPDDIVDRASRIKLSTGGATMHFRRHVAAFADQLARNREDAAAQAEAHRARLAGLQTVAGHRVEKGRYGAKNKTAWRVWLKKGGHVLVYLRGRNLTAEQAVAEALASGNSGAY